MMDGMMMDQGTFRETFGSVFERSPWVSDAVYEGTAGVLPAETDVLINLFEAAFKSADADLQLDVLRAHPELACARADRQQLTSDSRREQSGAGLDQCSKEEFDEFRQLNEAYGKKFGFPFIIAVKGRGRQDILEAFRKRIQNDPDIEFVTALDQVCRIARFRIMAIQKTMGVHNA